MSKLYICLLPFYFNKYGFQKYYVKISQLGDDLYIDLKSSTPLAIMLLVSSCCSVTEHEVLACIWTITDAFYAVSTLLPFLCRHLLCSEVHVFSSVILHISI